MPPFLVVDSSIFKFVTRALECAEKRDVMAVRACAAVLASSTWINTSLDKELRRYPRTC